MAAQLHDERGPGRGPERSVPVEALTRQVHEGAITLTDAVNILLTPAPHLPAHKLIVRRRMAAALTTQPPSAPTAPPQARLDWLLLSGCVEEAARRTPTAVLADLAAAAPQRVCSKTFSHGDVIWKCRTCQVGDDTCVVCQACFQDGDHRGHDVSFYISRQVARPKSLTRTPPSRSRPHRALQSLVLPRARPRPTPPLPEHPLAAT